MGLMQHLIKKNIKKIFNPEDLEKLLAIFGMEDSEIDEDIYDNISVTDASFVSDYVGNAIENNDY